MDVGELLSFKPTTAPKRPAASDVFKDILEDDDPSELIVSSSHLFANELIL